MQIVKQVCKGRVVIRSDRYDHSLTYVFKLMAVAVNDFPGLDLNKVEVVIYHGDHLNGIMGIEFEVEGNVRDDYQEIHQLEFTK